MRGESLVNHERKDLVKMSKLLLFYYLQIGVYSYIVKLYFWERSFFHEVVMFETVSLLFYIIQNGFKYTVNFLEHVTLSNMQTSKNRLFLFSDLIIHSIKITLQMIFLIRFTYYYNYPIFWARDIFLSLAISYEYIRKYIHSLKMVKGIDR